MPRRMHRSYGAVRESANHENSTGIADSVNEDVK
jgi:hypothetical protein